MASGASGRHLEQPSGSYGSQGIQKRQGRRRKIWGRIQGLSDGAKPEAEKPKTTKKAKGGGKAAKGAPAKGKSGKKATPAKNAPKAKKAAKGGEGPREGSKTAQVVAMLQREERGHAGRDHGNHGMAEAHRPRIHGRGDEEGRVRG